MLLHDREVVQNKCEGARHEKICITTPWSRTRFRHAVKVKEFC
jgi:hypothetical protein